MLATVRDVAIILVAVETLVIGILLAILVIQLVRLTRLVRDEVLPITNAAQETVSNVRGTTTFVSDHVVQPIVRLASVGAGARGAVNALLGLRSATRNASRLQQQAGNNGHDDQ